MERPGRFNFLVPDRPTFANAADVRNDLRSKDSDGANTNHGSLASPYTQASPLLALAQSETRVTSFVVAFGGSRRHVSAIDNSETRRIDEAFLAHRDNRA